MERIEVSEQAIRAAEEAVRALGNLAPGDAYDALVAGERYIGAAYLRWAAERTQIIRIVGGVDREQRVFDARTRAHLNTLADSLTRPNDDTNADRDTDADRDTHADT